jgi:hypothetical protein
MSRKYGKLFQVNKTKKESQDNHEIRVEADRRQERGAEPSIVYPREQL